ncbi:flavin prenyltransferase UbiX [Chlamydiifrater phoenicopteri]|uniref:flavin prenyltransferase UbiX n=1 Tax=Chlamydiifrater phoenicopteri TaxID=2681469 RepID=UPI001BD0BEF9|nr:flavin prenyltransferase UbiX [Chlamydiifrater phoenicopteri]
MGRYVIGISGASGSILAVKAIQTLLQLNHQVEIVLSAPAMQTIAYEIPKVKNKQDFFNLFSNRESLSIHKNSDIGSSIASGSYKTDGMAIVPCSMATVAAISIGLSDNLLRRAADVTIKERRPLIIVPRESPLHSIHLSNLLNLSKVGATIVPPLPLWYTKPSSIDEMENAIVGKILSCLGVSSPLEEKWEGFTGFQEQS